MYKKTINILDNNKKRLETGTNFVRFTNCRIRVNIDFDGETLLLFFYEYLNTQS